MKNRLLAHAIITTSIVVGAQCWWALMSPASTVPLQNQQSLFKVVKHCQIKKL
jgi:hypothetical protein